MKVLSISNDKIIELYKSGLSVTEIARLASCGFYSINKVLIAVKEPKRNLSETMRKYPLNENFFDVIDTEEKAYFLGLLYADGNNYVQKNRISIQLQSQDKNILERFSSLIFNQEKELQYIKSEILLEKYICSSKHKLVITNKHMSQRLVELGCVPKKSLILIFPKENQVSSTLIHHFIRGYFDGDGCIHISNTYPNICSVSFLGTENFLLATQEVLMKECNLNKITLRKHANIYCLNYQGRRQDKRIRDFLYKDATIYLDRKFHKFQSL